MWRDGSGWITPTRLTMVLPHNCEVFHNSRQKSSLMNVTRMITGDNSTLLPSKDISGDYGSLYHGDFVDQYDYPGLVPTQWNDSIVLKTGKAPKLVLEEDPELVSDQEKTVLVTQPQILLSWTFMITATLLTKENVAFDALMFEGFNKKQKGSPRKSRPSTIKNPRITITRYDRDNWWC